VHERILGIHDVQQNASFTEANLNHVPSFLDIVKLSEVFATSWNSLSAFSNYNSKRHLASSSSGNSPPYFGNKSGVALCASLPCLSQSSCLETTKSTNTSNANDIKNSMMASPVAGDSGSALDCNIKRLIPSSSGSYLTIKDSSSSEMCLKKVRTSRNFGSCRSEEYTDFTPITIPASQESMESPCTSFVPITVKGISKTISLDTYLSQASETLLCR